MFFFFSHGTPLPKALITAVPLRRGLAPALAFCWDPTKLSLLQAMQNFSQALRFPGRRKPAPAQPPPPPASGPPLPTPPAGEVREGDLVLAGGPLLLEAAASPLLDRPAEALDAVALLAGVRMPASVAVLGRSRPKPPCETTKPFRSTQPPLKHPSRHTGNSLPLQVLFPLSPPLRAMLPRGSLLPAAPVPSSAPRCPCPLPRSRLCWVSVCLRCLHRSRKVAILSLFLACPVGDLIRLPR